MALELVLEPEVMEDMLEISQGRALEGVAAVALVPAVVGSRTSSIPVLKLIAAVPLDIYMVVSRTSSIPVMSPSRVLLQDIKEAS